LKEAVASALSQAYDNIEILIGDDGASESIPAWSQTIVSHDRRVSYQRNERNLGLAGNWNALAKAARGEFLVIIGDDDRILPDFVRRLVKAIQPYARVAFANHYLINSEGGRLETETFQHTRRYCRDILPAGEVINAEVVVWQNSVPISAALMRTMDVQRLRFKEDLNTPEIEFFVRLAQEGARFVFVPDYLSEYRVHPQSAATAGLRGEKLAEHLLAISVALEVELYKRKFMASLLVGAVTRCLQQGEREWARRFLTSEYYPRPRWKQVRSYLKGRCVEVEPAGLQGKQKDTSGALRYFLSGHFQGLCASLPALIGCPLYRLIHRLKSSANASCSSVTR
jgi:glycosyltransferase involved in cell wall biosynthesis